MSPLLSRVAFFSSEVANMPDELRIASETEWRAWIAYYDAQAALFAELAEGASSPEQCVAFRDREHDWREKARNLRQGSFRRTA
jgi:hypothetical protein